MVRSPDKSPIDDATLTNLSERLEPQIHTTMKALEGFTGLLQARRSHEHKNSLAKRMVDLRKTLGPVVEKESSVSKQACIIDPPNVTVTKIGPKERGHSR